MSKNITAEYNRTFLAVSIVLITILILVCTLISKNRTFERYNSWETVPDAFIRQYTYQEFEDADSPSKIRREYVFECPEVKGPENILAIYMIHQYGAVLIDGEERTALVREMPVREGDTPGEDVNISFALRGRTPGGNWLIVPLTPEDSSKIVTVKAQPVFREMRRTPVSIRITTEAELMKDCFKEDFPQMVISILVMLCSVAFFGTYFYYRRIDPDPQKIMLYIGFVGILTGIWRLTDLRFMDLYMSRHTQLLSYISVSALMLALPFLIVVLSINTGEKNSLWMQKAAMIVLAADIVIVALHVMDIMDIWQFANALNVLLFLITLSGTLLMVGRVEKDNNPYMLRLILLYLLCLAGVTIDVTSYLVTQSSTGSIYTMLAFMGVVVSAGVTSLQDYFGQKKKIEEQEKELIDNRIAIMMSQIQPHFLYNSLASIYYLCDEDPQLAKKAIDEFSSYLRMNMDSLKQTKNVEFARELKHIENYLSLEKMRYEDKLNIFYNIETTDFLVPALSVQPIVENAVRHGVSKQPEGGTVIISAYEKDEHYEIVVEDDGVGFDPEKGSSDKNRSHIGIENVRYRLREMCGGTMDINSEIGLGTIVTIRIPKDQTRYRKED